MGQAIFHPAPTTVMSCNHLKDVFRLPASPSLCRWRCHMWQLWSKQGVELPACWDFGLFASYRQTRLWDKVQAAPASQPAKICFVFFVFFSLWEEHLCSGHAALIQNHGQRSCTEGERWQQAEEGEISAPPLVEAPVVHKIINVLQGSQCQSRENDGEYCLDDDDGEGSDRFYILAAESTVTKVQA